MKQLFTYKIRIIGLIVLLGIQGLSETASAQNQPCEAVCGNSLVVNGDFQAGNTGFASELVSNCNCAFASFCIGTSGLSKCSFYSAVQDHTFGSPAGLYMIVDGPNTFSPSTDDIWSQNVTVTAGEAYNFSYWLFPSLSLSVGGGVELALIVNNTEIGRMASNYDPSRGWIQICSQWVSNVTGTVGIRIRQVNAFGGGGFDYGLDDIEFVPSVNQVVHNQDFENGALIPDDRNQLDRADEWFAATGTPDLFDARVGLCAPFGCGTSVLDFNCVGVPCNHLGNENVNQGGNRYAGVWFAAGSRANPTIDALLAGTELVTGNGDFRILVEGVEVPMDQLDPSLTYDVELFVSRAERGEAEGLVEDAQAHFVVKMSTAAVQSPRRLNLLESFDPLEEDVIFRGFTTQTNGWQRITFTFRPNKAYTHLIIESSYTADVVRRAAELAASNGNDRGLETYMYIDDITIRSRCRTAPPVVNAGADLYVCSRAGNCGNPTLNPAATGGTPPYTYRWTPSAGLSNPNVQNPTACPSATTTYTVLVTDANGQTATDQLVFGVSNLIASAGPDIEGCVNQVQRVIGSATGGSAPYSYSWSPAGFGGCPGCQFIDIKYSGSQVYTLSVSDARGCTASDALLASAKATVNEQVINGGFESGGVPQGRDEFGTQVDSWVVATGKPDIFDARTACSALGTNDPNCVDVPSNHFGNEAHNGAGVRYGGLGAAVGATVDRKTVTTIDLKLLTEGIESELRTSLVANKVYEMTLDVSRAENGEIPGGRLSHIPHFVVKFSNVLEDSGPTGFGSVGGDVAYRSSTNQNNGWQKITFNFKTQTSYRYLIIESEVSEEAVDRVRSLATGSVSLASLWLETYMYIDNVSIREQCGTPANVITVVRGASRRSNPSLSAEPGNTAELPSFSMSPNPSNGSMKLHYTLGSEKNAVLEICNILGQSVLSLPLDPRLSTAEIDATSLAEGIYYYRVSSGGTVLHTDKAVIRR
jgi:hypothetical protein